MPFRVYDDDSVGPLHKRLADVLAIDEITLEAEKLQESAVMVASPSVGSITENALREHVKRLSEFLKKGRKVILTFYAEDEDEARRTSIAYRLSIGANIGYKGLPIKIPLSRTYRVADEEIKEMTVDKNHLEILSAYIESSLPFDFEKEEKLDIGDSERNDGFEFFENIDKKSRKILLRHIASIYEHVDFDAQGFVGEDYISEDSMSRDLRHEISRKYHEILGYQVVGIITGGLWAMTGNPFSDDILKKSKSNEEFARQLIKYAGERVVVKNMAEKEKPETHRTSGLKYRGRRKISQHDKTPQQTVDSEQSQKMKPIKLYPEE